MPVTTSKYEVDTSPIGTLPTPIDGPHPLDSSDIIWLLFDNYLLRK